MAVYNSFEDFHSIPVTKPTTGKWRSLRVPPRSHIGGHYIQHCLVNGEPEFDRSASKASESSSKNSGVLYASTSTLCSCSSKTGCVSPVSLPIKWCIWKKPEIGWIKLNTDGSVSAIGGLLRDHNGWPLCAYFAKTLHKNTFMVELSAIWRGLHLALSLGIRTIWIESDSLSVVKTINRQQPGGPSSGCYLSEIRKLLAHFDDYRVTHTWREANKAADYVSRMDVELKDVVFWPTDFPDTLHDIIKDDAQGKIYFRH
ncbi:hypothetical protein HRI_003155700 [Hibiscus trionum]|uniref:RNase H type-1 domain-containing protein n=1 Tax=Hibiscus trionum TaxID=183268 RepID=A0A9W7MC31_HIBTR|nr:hypothetical protein HRI_003155700 [Hibiscus trionum]